jgi:predicted acylesterase/phospholipase RssA
VLTDSATQSKAGGFLNPPDLCDLIMQGGITSGVVYPGAVLKLAPRFRFRSIGGTSAGAIAAAATAAAEYGRVRGGFERLSELPHELGEHLLSLFQPARPFRSIFGLFLACLGNRHWTVKIADVFWRFFACFPFSILFGQLPLAIYICRTWHKPRIWEEWIALSLAFLGALLISWVCRLAWLLLVSLPKFLFGVCPGLTQRGSQPALTNWLTDLFDHLACLDDASQTGIRAPLTFGQLADANIELKMMTTNLSSRRPYSLPFVTDPNKPERDGRYAFNQREWTRYFPERVMTWLIDHAVEVTDNTGYRFLPDATHLPVIVAVRLSLSFPGLLSALPLYRRDYTYLQKPDYEKLRRCIFSDGGISSNFPIHFFDSLLPTRPTFAIALDDYSPLRCKGSTPQDRVSMPKSADEGFILPVTSVDSLPSFLGSIVNSARNWQDNLQRILPGYRERIADVLLCDKEGGLNLTMGPDLIHNLDELGEIAGDRMLRFDLKEHQWRRFLVAYARLEETFERMNLSYANGFKDFLDTYPPNHTKSYSPSHAWFDAVHERTKALITLTAPWSDDPLRSKGKIPKPDTDLRITPKP